ncbi:MAG: cupin protein [Herminiimonas sp.]|nr:cupin protein [Herminiimonas sp.]
MIAVKDHLVVRDIGDGEYLRFLTVALASHALELHAHFQWRRQSIAWLYLHQVCIVFAKGIDRFNLNFGLVANILSAQRLFDLREGVAVVAVQVHHRFAAFFDQIALGIRQLVVQRYHRIFRYFHGTSFDSKRNYTSGSPVQYLCRRQARQRHTGLYNGRMKKLTLLGQISPDEFLRTYWQKKPLLVRQAIPGFKPVLTREELFELAGRDDVESRLVTRLPRKWQLQDGPNRDLPPPSKKKWSLLVQGVNLHNAAADALLRQFRFIPDTRLDDLMISYASDEGGVGPHFDSYDVFLLQAQGTRRWRIGAQTDLSLEEGAPLKLLRNFAPEQEFDLEPGDMLYLPPHYAHDGVALGECMTYSIGFRAPSYQELAEVLLQAMADTVEIDGRYSDPELAPAKRPAEIDTAMLSKIEQELARIRITPEDILLFLGEHLSSPKPATYFIPPVRPLPLERFVAKACKTGVILSPKTRMLYRRNKLFINGESFLLSPDDRGMLITLANERELNPDQISNRPSDGLDALHQWYQHGWLTLR